MTRPFDAILLAGALHPSPLQSALGRPLLCLPLRHGETLLDAWLSALAQTGGCREVVAVVNTEADAAAVRAAARSSPTRPPLVVVAEPARWRGPAGLLRDVAARLDGDPRPAANGERGPILVIEASCLPPPTLGPLLAALRCGGGSDVAAVGAGAGGEPAGTYALDPAVCEYVPAVGYFDIKEQLLPALNRAGRRVTLVRLDDHAVLRIRDRDGYLAAIRLAARRPSAIRHGGSENGWTSVNGAAAHGARIAGDCIVEAGVRLGRGAVVHDSVLLSGAVVGPGAVVSRSVLGPHAFVPGGGRIVDRILSGSP